MEFVFTLMALAIPALLGSLWSGLLIPACMRGRRALVWGNGLLAGLLLIPLIMRLLDALGAPLTFGATAFFAVTLIVIALMLHGYGGYERRNIKLSESDFAMLPVAYKLLFMLLFTLIAIRLGTLGLELLWRPLFPWDATMHWATKSRVWFDQAALVPFVENDLWLEMRGNGVFTDHHPAYPITTPLLQVWMTSALGRWDDSLMNLPWLLCLAALGTVFYGQARASGAGPIIAIVFTYLLLTMPLINTHVALAGYADIFLGACYATALMAFHNWSVRRQSWQAALAIFFGLSCTLIKNEGFFWLLTLVPALVVVLIPWRKALMLLIVALTILVGVLMLLPPDANIAGHSLNQLKFQYRPKALGSIASLFWVHDSWHLFAYLLIPAFFLGFMMPGSNRSAYLGISTALACSLLLFLILFTFTGYAGGAVRFTAVGRISLQIVPGLMFLAMLLCNEILARGHQDKSRFRNLQGNELLGQRQQ